MAVELWLAIDVLLEELERESDLVKEDVLDDVAVTEPDFEDEALDVVEGEIVEEAVSELL